MVKSELTYLDQHHLVELDFLPTTNGQTLISNGRSLHHQKSTLKNLKIEILN